MKKFFLILTLSLTILFSWIYKNKSNDGAFTNKPSAISLKTSIENDIQSRSTIPVSMSSSESLQSLALNPSIDLPSNETAEDAKIQVLRSDLHVLKRTLEGQNVIQILNNPLSSDTEKQSAQELMQLYIDKVKQYLTLRNSQLEQMLAQRTQ